MRLRLALLTLVGLGALAPSAQAQQWTPGGPGIPIVCAYNSTPPTVTTGEFVYAQCGSSGTLLGGGGGGGGGAVTLAAGSVSAGAYVAGSLVDGSNITMGLTTDTAWSGTGAGTEIAILKKIAAGISTTGVVTIAAGGVAVGAYHDGALVTLGTEADTAWASGNGTAIAILKKIAGNTAAGGGAVTIADGASVTLGAKADTALTTGSATVIALLKGLIAQVQSAIPAGANFIGGLSPPATISNGQGNCGTGTGTTALVPARTGIFGTGRQAVTIVNDGTVDEFIGATGVTGSTGLLLVGIKGTALTLNTTAPIYCFAASTTTASYLESY